MVQIYSSFQCYRNPPKSLQLHALRNESTVLACLTNISSCNGRVQALLYLQIKNLQILFTCTWTGCVMTGGKVLVDYHISSRASALHTVGPPRMSISGPHMRDRLVA